MAGSVCAVVNVIPAVGVIGGNFLTIIDLGVPLVGVRNTGNVTIGLFPVQGFGNPPGFSLAPFSSTLLFSVGGTLVPIGSL